MVTDIIILLPLLCCYSLFLIYFRYKKIMKEILNKILENFLISLIPEYKQALHMVSEPGFKTKTCA
jgi:hypothetical protein